ncbi:hypothetical protein F0Q45_08305 [Mycobacterium simiae]|uniref:Uncharacterized protein n=1 Tax=Mycobacterium simiae TaxID=1784 RepID=A0A5B1BQD9_MYCSI|nr:hypothetical protein [Mycobacterium simiae]KAA1250686.1 hypothetical protein F0Q45_08305 [Mycobacterium simiae]
MTAWAVAGVNARIARLLCDAGVVAPDDDVELVVSRLTSQAFEARLTAGESVDHIASGFRRSLKAAATKAAKKTSEQRIPIDEDIDGDRAWQLGRRIYVRCGYTSRLGEDLRRMGAHWDRDAKQLWVGSGKKSEVIAAVQAADQRLQRVEEIKRQARYISIPYRAVEIRAEAKKLGGLWDRDRKQWAFTTAAAYDRIQQLLEHAQRCEEAAAEGARGGCEEAGQVATQAGEAAQSRRARLIAESRRVPTGEEAEWRVVSTRRMNKVTAWAMAKPLGAIVRLRDGRRGVVIDRKVWFTGEDDASSMCWHAETHDEAHWDLLHTVAIVEPTAEERSADEAERAERADAAEIHDIVTELSHTGDVALAWTTIDDAMRVGIICRRYGSSLQSGGTLVLTTDDRLIFQHPGWYDDYIQTERVVLDPDLVARVGAILARGNRTRMHADQMNYYYEVIQR